jgi:hypothetical protein
MCTDAPNRVWLLTKVDPGTSSMRKEAVVVVLDVGHRDDVQLLLATAASRVDGEQDRPGDEAADQARNDRHAQKAEEEVAIKRVVGQDIGIGNLEEGREPVEEAVRESRAALTSRLLAGYFPSNLAVVGIRSSNAADEAPRGIATSKLAAQEEKGNEPDEGEEGDRGEGAEQGGGRVGGALCRANVGV